MSRINLNLALLLCLSFQQTIQVSSFSTNQPISTPAFVQVPRIKGTTTTSLSVLQLEDVDWLQSTRRSLLRDLRRKNKQLADSFNKEDNFLTSAFAQIASLSQLDVQSQQSRTTKSRGYARSTPFEDEHLYSPATLKDLSPPPSALGDTFWMSMPSVLLSFAIPYISFPYLVQFLDHFVTIDASTLGSIASKFGPGVSILYGTFVSITLSLLYQRQEDIQDIAAKESSLLAMNARNLLTLFKKDHTLAVAAGQCVADQIRTMSSGSRCEELKTIMQNDPYGRMMDLVEQIEDKWINSSTEKETKKRVDLLGKIRDTTQDLYELRASRLSHEALSLPPTHFFILTCLTNLILLGYTIDILPTVTFTDMGVAVPPFESNLLFGLLSSVYVLFYNSASDLNDPFRGIYQIRRGSIACHLMQAKSLLLNHPLLRGKVCFKTPQ